MKFKVGQIVQYVGRNQTYSEKWRIGDIGVVTKAEPLESPQIYVLWIYVNLNNREEPTNYSPTWGTGHFPDNLEILGEP